MQYYSSTWAWIRPQQLALPKAEGVGGNVCGTLVRDEMGGAVKGRVLTSGRRPNSALLGGPRTPTRCAQTRNPPSDPCPESAYKTSTPP